MRFLLFQVRFLVFQSYYLLIETMNNAGDYAALLHTELINSIQIHYSTGKQMTFVNTILHQSSKLIPSNLTPKFQIHQESQSGIANLPFCVINKAHLKEKNDTYKLIITLVGLSEARKQQNEPRAIDTTQLTLKLSSVLSQCEELSEVASLLNQEYLNQYWILLNPVFKMRQNLLLTKLKEKVLSKSQFFKNAQQFNQDYFIYRLNLLQNYVNEIKKERVSLVSNKFIKICLIALIKHLKDNCTKLYQLAITQPLLQQIKQNHILTLEELKQYEQKARDENIKANGAYGYFQLPKAQQKQQEKQEYETMKQKLMKALVKPVSVTAFLLILGASLSS